jgi:serine/threonine protein kinase
VVARFEAERQALALMDHPNIAHVFDGGETGSGRPYFVMELVRGIPITDFCDQSNLPIRQRLELFVSVCQAVQHAHQKGIIHRDIKPGNVLVTEVDGRPTPKVIDFGVAKATELKLTDLSFADTGSIVGTPAYMSPEQAEGKLESLGPATDVYSLGATLYHVLCGKPPFETEDLDDILVKVKRADFPRPRSVFLEVPLALEAICLKAMALMPADRYQTARSVADDLERWLADKPISIVPETIWDGLLRFTRQNLALVVVLIVLLMAFVVLFTRELQRLSHFAE